MYSGAFKELRNSAIRRLGWGLTACLLFGANSAGAKSYFVEISGNDSNPCTNALPCRTISYVLLIVGTGDVVNVGPGHYEESLQVTNDRLKLIAREGAESTIISPHPLASSEGATVEINADNVVFGQRNRGFGVRATSLVGGVRVVGNSARIEGNFITGLLNSNAAGIHVTGDKGTVRYNDVRVRSSSARTSPSVGVRLDAVPVSGRDTGMSHLVQENEVSGAARCYQITSYATNNRNRFINNVGELCGAGVRIDNNLPGAAGTARFSGDVVTGSVFRLDTTSVEFPYGVLIVGGTPTISNTHVDMSVGGFIGMGTFITSNSVMRASSVVASIHSFTDSGQAGLMSTGRGETRIENNRIIGTVNGMRFSSFGTVKAIKNNSIYGVSCPLFFASVQATLLNFIRNYWDGGGRPDLSCNTEAADSEAAGRLKFRPRNAPL